MYMYMYIYMPYCRGCERCIYMYMYSGLSMEVQVCVVD